MNHCQSMGKHLQYILDNEAQGDPRLAYAIYNRELTRMGYDIRGQGSPDGRSRLVRKVNSNPKKK